MAVVIASELLARIVAAAAGSPAAEVCGLLLGPARQAGRRQASSAVQTNAGDTRWADQAGVTSIDAVVACANVAADPARRFEIDPAALLAAHRRARAGEPAVIGHYHSHPSGDPTPSPRDAADAVADGSLWLIVSGGEVRAFRAVAAGALHGRFDPVALRVAP